jgi:hypothetical protein
VGDKVMPLEALVQAPRPLLSDISRKRLFVTGGDAGKAQQWPGVLPPYKG